MTINEAAVLLECSRSFVERHLSELGASKRGRVYRIPASGVEAFIAANRVPPPSRFSARKRPASLDRQQRTEEVRSLKAAVLGR